MHQQSLHGIAWGVTLRLGVVAHLDCLGRICQDVNVGMTNTIQVLNHWHTRVIH